MGNHCEVAGQQAALKCDAPNCRNPVTDTERSMRIMTGAGEIMDFCNRTCLKDFMARGRP